MDVLGEIKAYDFKINGTSINLWQKSTINDDTYYSNGNVGIGTTNPTFHDYTTTTGTDYHTNPILQLSSATNSTAPEIRLTNTATNTVAGTADLEIIAAYNSPRLISNYGLWLFLDAANTHSDEYFGIFSNNNYGAGSLLFKVNQDGYVGAHGMKLTMGTFPDYVFNENYNLKKIDEVESFIKENKHLPDMPTACEVEDNGLDVGEMNAKLVQKVEELTLYLIDLKKENDKLKTRVDVLEKK